MQGNDLGIVGDEQRLRTNGRNEEESSVRRKKASTALLLLTGRRREPSLTRALTNSIHRLGLSQDLWLSTDGVCYHHERFNCFCGRPSSDRRAAPRRPGMYVLYVRLVDTRPSVFRGESNELHPAPELRLPSTMDIGHRIRCIAKERT